MLKSRDSTLRRAVMGGGWEVVGGGCVWGGPDPTMPMPVHARVPDATRARRTGSGCLGRPPRPPLPARTVRAGTPSWRTPPGSCRPESQQAVRALQAGENARDWQRQMHSTDSPRQLARPDCVALSHPSQLYVAEQAEQAMAALPKPHPRRLHPRTPPQRAPLQPSNQCIVIRRSGVIRAQGKPPLAREDVQEFGQADAGLAGHGGCLLTRRASDPVCVASTRRAPSSSTAPGGLSSYLAGQARLKRLSCNLCHITSSLIILTHPLQGAPRWFAGRSSVH